jgi:hypothetical protein
MKTTKAHVEYWKTALRLSGEGEVVDFWRLGMHLFFGGSSSLMEAKSSSSVGGFSSF